MSTTYPSSASTNSKLVRSAGPNELDPYELDVAFPFNLIVDHSIRIVHAGPILTRLLPDLAGDELGRTFIVRRPRISIDFGEIVRSRNQMFTLACKPIKSLLLRGQMLYLPDTEAVIFLGVPCLRTSSEIDVLGLARRAVDQPGIVPDHRMASPGRALMPNERLSLMNRTLEERIAELNQDLIVMHERLAATNQSLRDEIAARTRVTKKLRLSEGALKSCAEAIIITDARSVIVTVNEAFTRITGYEAHEVVGKNPRILRSSRHRPAFYRRMWKAISEAGHWEGEIWDKRKTGEIYPKRLSISTIHDQDGSICNYVGIFTDISERKASEEQINYIKYYDPLTGLPNRTLLKERFKLALALARRHRKSLGILFLDLDHFNTINDHLGHDFGDELLAVIGRRLASTVQKRDTVARLGGDEFVILLTDLESEARVADIAKQIHQSLAERVQLGGHEIYPSVSIGISIFPNDGDDFHTLEKNADIALYRAKCEGRNDFRFHAPEMNERIATRFAIQEGLRRALEHDELVLYFQPQINIASGMVTGADALVRWIDPEHGIVMPADFIPVAEESALILRLGEWVLKSACIQLRSWRDAGVEAPTVAINLSARQFRREDLFELIQLSLNENGLNGSSLELEVTESALMEDFEAVELILRRLKAIGVKISLDDFGTGYSSLGYLKRFQIDKLKIDRSFVEGIGVDPENTAICVAVIDLAHNLGLTVIAEGVETSSQMSHLRSQNCDEMQGYYFSPPLPPDQFAQLIAAQLPQEELDATTKDGTPPRMK